MPYLKLSDGTDLYYKDWGNGEPVVFSHGWPLSSDAFEDQMLYLANKGYRVVAHDRRGHGRSSQPWDGHNMDQYAEDLHELVQHLGLKNAVHVGHSTGGGEVARYTARYGNNVKKAVLIGAIPPLMVKTENNPEGTPIDVFDGIREGLLKDRSSFFRELAVTFYGFNHDTDKRSQGLIDGFWLQGQQASIRALYDCIGVFSETNQTEDLKAIKVPTLVLYGDDDQIVPPAASSKAALKLLQNATEKVYKGASHGLCSTHKDEVSKDILEFIEN